MTRRSTKSFRAKMASDDESTGRKRKRERLTSSGCSAVSSTSPAATPPIAQDLDADKHAPETPDQNFAPKRYDGTQRTLNRRDLTVTQFLMGTKDSGKENARLFRLTKTDQDVAGVWGIAHSVAITMLYVLSGNDCDVFLTTDKDGKQNVVKDIEVFKCGLLKGDKYYCWGSGGTELRIVVRWEDWKFPHDDWEKGKIWSWRDNEPFKSNTRICPVTGRSTSTSAMHWTGYWDENPEMAAKWFKENDMAVRYAHGDFDEVETVDNIVYMRCDLHRSIDCGELLVAQKGSGIPFTLHATAGKEAVGYVEDGYHGAIVEIPAGSAPFVFARFAFTTIEILSRYKETHSN